MKLERETVHISDDRGRIALVENLTIDNYQLLSIISSLIRYQYCNHLSTATLELDENGNPISYEEYHPFGTSSYRAVDTSIERAAKRYRYTGKERDEETGLYYHGARYYISWLGRWLKADPGGLIDGINIYRYSKNRPSVNNDSTGLYTVEKDEGIHAKSTSTITHTTQSGDTYSALAKKYGVSVQSLRDLNGYNDKNIPIGVELKIKGEQEYYYNSELKDNQEENVFTVVQEIGSERYEVEFTLTGVVEGEIAIQIGYDGSNYDAYVRAGLNGKVEFGNLDGNLNYIGSGATLSMFGEMKLGMQSEYFDSYILGRSEKVLLGGNSAKNNWKHSLDVVQDYRLFKPVVEGSPKKFVQNESSSFVRFDFGLKVSPIHYSNEKQDYEFRAVGKVKVEGKKQQLLYAPLAIFLVTKAKIEGTIGIKVKKTKINN